MHHLVFDYGSWDGPLLRAGSAMGELRAVEFVPISVAVDRMDEHEARRLQMAVRAIETGQHFYLHNGSLPPLHDAAMTGAAAGADECGSREDETAMAVAQRLVRRLRDLADAVVWRVRMRRLRKNDPHLYK